MFPADGDQQTNQLVVVEKGGGGTRNMCGDLGGRCDSSEGRPFRAFCTNRPGSLGCPSQCWGGVNDDICGGVVGHAVYGNCYCEGNVCSEVGGECVVPEEGSYWVEVNCHKDGVAGYHINRIDQLCPQPEVAGHCVLNEGSPYYSSMGVVNNPSSVLHLCQVGEGTIGSVTVFPEYGFSCEDDDEELLVGLAPHYIPAGDYCRLLGFSGYVEGTMISTCPAGADCSVASFDPWAMSACYFNQQSVWIYSMDCFH
jgi:hypothetical protein